MAKNSERAEATKPQDPASADFPDLAQIGPAVFFKASMVYWQGLLEWQKEILGFLGNRIRKDAKLEHMLANGWNALDLIKVQQDWAATAMKEYVNESVKLFSLANRSLLEPNASEQVRR